MREHAMALAASGLHVFPLREKDKTPVTTNGFKDATDDLGRVAAMWGDRWDGAPCRHNIGIACGASGLLVVDLDGEAGVAQLDRFTPTLTVSTGNGLHLYYSGTAKSSVRALGDGIDTRGIGGYVVAPPSLHPSGHRYAWIDQSAPVEPLPDWIRTRLAPRKQEQLKRRRRPDPQMRSVLIWSAVERLRGTVEGGRNNALNRECYYVRDLEEPQYLAILFVAEGEALGLGREECVKTVASALGVSQADVEGWL